MTASTIFLYPVQRQRLPAIFFLMVSSVGSGIFLQDGLGGQDHARRAEAALQRALIHKGLLQGMKLTGFGSALRWS